MKLDSYPIPAIAVGLRLVSQKEFFERINTLDVNPAAKGKYHQYTAYTTEWRLPSGQLVGVSDGADTFDTERWWLL